MNGGVSPESPSVDAAERSAQPPPRVIGVRDALRKLAARVDRNQRLLLVAGLVGLAALMIFSVPGNPVFDVNQRRHHLVGMLLSHASVVALLAGCYPSRAGLLHRARRWSPAVWLGLAGLACTAILVAWLALFHAWPVYANSLARESGPLEPQQAALYVVASWLAWQCARRRAQRSEEERFFRVTSAFCAWLALEEIEYFGVVVVLLGDKIHGVWVRAAHDLIAVGVRVPAVLGALVCLAVVLPVAAMWYIGPSSVLRQATSLAALPAGLAAVAMVLAQVLDQDSTALAIRLEEPLELVGALLLVGALVLKYGEDGA